MQVRFIASAMGAIFYSSAMYYAGIVSERQRVENSTNTNTRV